MSLPLAPLTFRPVYKRVLWGGRRLGRWRDDLPEGSIGESWELADHDAGMTVVAAGPLAGTSLRELVARHGRELVGQGFRGGGPFPVLVKLIDAADRLSVQVHPDDGIARRRDVGGNGKTECWLFLDDGGELYQGTRPGVGRDAFARAIAEGRGAEVLNRFEPRAGDCFFLPGRTVHALGAGCLVYELQQTLDVTFRVDDWGRVDADGKPRPLHLAEALETIDFEATGFGPRRPPWNEVEGGARRELVDCAYFRLEERRLTPGSAPLGLGEGCAVVTCVEGEGVLATPGGEVALAPARTVLVPATAEHFRVDAVKTTRILVAQPRF